jgi:hypothetical protein
MAKNTKLSRRGISNMEIIKLNLWRMAISNLKVKCGPKQM